jgi:hypothetical protein
VNVFIGDVAEYATDQNHLRRHGPGVCGRRGGVALDDLDASQSSVSRGKACVGHEERVELDQACLDVSLAGMVGQGADDVTTLA